MCGKAHISPFTKGWNPLDPVDMRGLWNEGIQPSMERGGNLNHWMKTYDSLHFLGGSALYKAQGFEGQDRRAARDKEKAQLAYLDQQYAPAAPSPSASIINQNAELRDRRRRAVLLGASQLEVPGPGAGSGGGYGGANAPLY